MYLEKLTIAGFKSFVKKTTFEFNHPFVAIVGPNGGGKTNVVDALRWVMGEQSPKLLRLKKSEDAIFSGSKKLARLGLAQVELYLNNQDQRLPIDYSEVVLARKLYRNGESEYSINKQPVRLSDIVLLLAKANFGQKSYGVIGQGMITNILNANPQDRKEFFDEATGVKEFQIKRDQAINKLIRTEDNLGRAEDLLQEIEPRLKSLQRQIRKLEKRQEIEEELVQLQIEYYGSLWQELDEHLKIITHQKQEISVQQKDLESHLNKIQEALDTMSGEQSRSSLYQKLQQEYNEWLTQKNTLLKDQVVIKGQLEVEVEKQGELNLVWLERKKESLNNTGAKKQLEIAQLEKIIVELEKKIEEKLSEQKKNLHEFTELEYKVLKTKEDLQRKAEVLSVPEIRERLVNIFSQQELFLKRILATNNLETFKDVQQGAKTITSQLAGLLDEMYDRDDAEIAGQKKQIEILEKELNAKLGQKEKILEQINELRINIQGKKERILLWQENLSLEKTEGKSINAEIDRLNKTLSARMGKTEKLQLFQKQQVELNQKINKIEEKIIACQKKIDEFNEEEEYKKQELMRLQNQSRDYQQQLNVATQQINQLDIELAKTETRKEDLHNEINKELKPEKISEVKKWQGGCKKREEASVKIESLKHQLALIGTIDQETISEHHTTKDRFTFLSTQSKDMRSTIDKLEIVIDELDATIKKQFSKSFQAIAENFSKYFSVIFAGGNAKLSLITEEQAASQEQPAEPEEEVVVPLGKRKKTQKIISGIEIEATPPNKKVHNVHALSGGEKSMTAIALICAIIAANTPPFVVLDEVEAALDESNSEKFGAIIKKLSKKTQFITITHNRSTMHYADILYGVTMGLDGASNILSVKLEEAKKMMVDKEK